MRAVWMRATGDPSVLVPEETPEPEPGPGQLLIDVAYANVTFVETQLRAAVPPFSADPPVVPGNGVGGVVTAVGSGVDPDLIGRRVVSTTGGSGGYAERVAVAADLPVPVPDEVGLDTAVALLADGRTALMLVDAVAPVAGERVLVEAAAGGVGTLLVQLVVAAGATVVAAAGGPDKGEVARRLGADVVVDYRRSDWPDRVRAATGGVDVVFDGVGGAVAGAAFDLLAHGGRMICYGVASGEEAPVSQAGAADRGVSLLGLPGADSGRMRAFTARALAEAAADRLRPVIGQRFPLARAADAHTAVETRATVGKTLLTVRP